MIIGVGGRGATQSITGNVFRGSVRPLTTLREVNENVGRGTFDRGRKPH